MLLEEFIEDFSNAPISLEELAQYAIEVEDNDKFVNSAKFFLASQEDFLDDLAYFGVELG